MRSVALLRRHFEEEIAMLFDTKRLKSVTSTIRSRAWGLQYNALKIPATWPGFIGDTLRNARIKRLYRSMIIARYAERLEHTDSADEARWILDRVIELLRPPVGLYLGLMSSHAGFVIVILAMRNAERNEARELRTLLSSS